MKLRLVEHFLLSVFLAVIPGFAFAGVYFGQETAFLDMPLLQPRPPWGLE